MKKGQHNDAQMEFAVFCPVKIIPTGVGTFKLEVGKPQRVMTPEDLAREMGGVNRESVYRWIREGDLPQAVPGPNGDDIVLWELRGKRGYRIFAMAVPYLKAKFKKEHDTRQCLDSML